jgi:protein TonB
VPVALLLHALIVLALAAPAIVAARSLLPEPATGAGGPGPAGGGGGGTRGTGGSSAVERIRYVQTRPAAAEPAAPEKVAVPAPVPPPRVEPVPDPEPEAVPQPTAPADVPPVSVAPATDTGATVTSATIGTGGGTGNDGTGGSGPGSGGGVGSGVGTGRGSGNGPGTGGGSGTIYPPTPEFTLIPPMPYPRKVRGRTVTALFSVDSTGKVTRVELSPGSGDGGYDRRLRETFASFRFRPATRYDGTPVAAVAAVSFTIGG